jgi:deoxyribodipyrimidine photolyase-related protein
MSNHCQDCFYKVKEWEGEKACPFNALYWDFIGKKEELLASNQRMSLILGLYRKFSPEKKEKIRQKAQRLREQADDL